MAVALESEGIHSVTAFLSTVKFHFDAQTRGRALIHDSFEACRPT